jgi:integrase
MARTVRDATLETRAARMRLPTGRKHWRSIEQRLHLGYRRGPRGGAWLGRRCVDGKYPETVLGIADDATDADGTTVLDYRAALKAAREWWQAEERKALGISDTRRGAYTVADALADYEKHYEARGGKDLTNLRSIVTSHILPTLGALDTAKLTTRRLRDWHHGLATAPKMVRTAKGAAERKTQKFNPRDPEAVRRRRSRANRILTVLKAALNHACAEHHISNDDAWSRVQPFRDVDQARIHYLSTAECTRLLNACDPDFRALVKAALLTGARYGELVRLKVRDVNLEPGSIFIAESKNGKPRHVPLTDEGIDHFRSLAVGKTGSAPVFLRADGATWKASHQARPLAAACEQAKIEPAITFHGLRDTYASMLAMRGVPMAVIAAVLGHADTRITEKHYAHLAPSYVADTIRANMPRLGLEDETNIASIRKAG